MKQNLPQVTTYTQYFSWPAPRRLEVRRQLREIPEGLRWQSSQFLNYEAHQPPLSYVLLLFPERFLAPVSLPVRVVLLRIVAAVAGSLLLLRGAEQLFLQIGARGAYGSVALFCLFSCQMTWATLAHIGNDWLAVPLAVWTLVALNRYDANPSARTAALAAGVLALGLLTKAYFLALVPLLAGLYVVRRRWREFAIAGVILCGLAGPWYARNLVRYRTLTGTPESRAGLGLPAVFHAAPTLDWTTAISSSVHSSLWTGNNTFSSFSTNTLNLIITTGLMALLLWAARHHSRAEWITFSYCGLFALALGYAAIVSHIFTRGALVRAGSLGASVRLGVARRIAMAEARQFRSDSPRDLIRLCACRDLRS